MVGTHSIVGTQTPPQGGKGRRVQLHSSNVAHSAWVYVLLCICVHEMCVVLTVDPTLGQGPS